MQDELAGSLRAARLRVYSGIGHTPRWEDPARFSAELVAFVRGLPET
jgi:pimeloyl-ACP methyl ester carboxylesterase